MIFIYHYVRQTISILKNSDKKYHWSSVIRRNELMLILPIKYKNNLHFHSQAWLCNVPSTHTLNTLSSHTAPWIIDSGATDHITCSLDCFYTYSTIAPAKIHLPNGSTIQAHISGNIKFTPDFIIHNVLFVPDFSFKLLSIPKLLYTFPCRIIFSSDLENLEF